MTHLTREELVRWRESGAAEDRNVIVSHLAACKACAATYAELVRTAASAPAPHHFDPADFVKRGYAVRGAAQASRWSAVFTPRTAWAGSLSAAAVLLLVVALWPGAQSGRPPSDGVRGSGIDFVVPAETTEQPAVVEWKSGIAAARFRVELVDASGGVLYQEVTDSSRIRLSPDIVMMLRPGSSYTWKVTALDRDGQPVTTSSRTFSIARASR